MQQFNIIPIDQLMNALKEIIKFGLMLGFLGVPAFSFLVAIAVRLLFKLPSLSESVLVCSIAYFSLCTLFRPFATEPLKVIVSAVIGISLAVASVFIMSTTNCEGFLVVLNIASIVISLLGGLDVAYEFDKKYHQRQQIEILDARAIQLCKQYPSGWLKKNEARTILRGSGQFPHEEIRKIEMEQGSEITYDAFREFVNNELELVQS